MKTKIPAREIIKPYVEKGLSIQEIVNITGLKYQTVQAARHKMIGTPVQKRTVMRMSGWNKDRHACKVCQYRLQGVFAKRLQAKCNYIECKGEKRPCKVEDCNVYQRGSVMKGKETE